ncbi:MAG: hypothetical protein GXX91_16685 [Verrucomicrobiaceae bacterium]|nr:hypothetical protein [Verrucomicrobiaceae bacterium]
MRTIFDLPEPIFREAKARAAREGVKLKELIVRYIEVGLRSPGVPDGGEKGHREPLPTAISREAGKPPSKVLGNRDLDALLEEDEFDRYQRTIASAKGVDT